MTDDIVTRLRAMSNHPYNQHGPHDTLSFAADAIERLTRELDAIAHRFENALVSGAKNRERAEAAERKLEKLREALKPFAILANAYDEGYDEPWKVSWYKECCRARAELKETEER